MSAFWPEKEETEQINANVRRWLAEHEITCIVGEGPVRLYKCQEPGTWIYGFHVTIGPGGLLFSGDIGELLVQRYADPDRMLGWVRDALGSPSYFVEKVPHDMRGGLARYEPEVKDRIAQNLREYYANEDAEGEDVEDETPSLADAFLEAAAYAESRDEVARAWYDTLSDRGICTADGEFFEVYTHTTMVILEALRWFTERVCPKKEA